MRLVWWIVGWTAVGIAFIGVWLPLVPTVPTLLVAVWAFTRASPAARQWLFDHPRFGPILRQWYEQGAIPRHAKLMSVSAMALSFAFMAYYTSWPLWGLALIGLLFIAVGIYVVTRPAPVRP